MAEALRIIWERDGWRGLRRGWVPRVLTVAPSTAISWMSYEFFSESYFGSAELVSLLGAARTCSCPGSNHFGIALVLVLRDLGVVSCRRQKLPSALSNLPCRTLPMLCLSSTHARTCPLSSLQGHHFSAPLLLPQILLPLEALGCSSGSASHLPQIFCFRRVPLNVSLGCDKLRFKGKC